MKTKKIIYYVATGLLSALFLFSAGMHLFKYSDISEIFSSLGFPTWIIYPLAVAKILAIIAIWTRKSKLLKEWGYAGLFFDSIIALGAHLSISDGEQGGAIMAIVLIIISRFLDPQVFYKRRSII